MKLVFSNVINWIVVNIVYPPIIFQLKKDVPNCCYSPDGCECREIPPSVQRVHWIRH